MGARDTVQEPGFVAFVGIDCKRRSNAPVRMSEVCGEVNG